MKTLSCSVLISLAALGAVVSNGCSTAPKAQDQTAFKAEARSAMQWFQRNVPGLDAQIRQSAGYIVYPSVGQWGILFGGGQFGRGTVETANGTQIGWGALNIASIGLQAGVRGFKMLVIFQDQATMDKFKSNQLSGSASGIVVVGETGTSGTAPFQNGVAVYQGASTGLMAGVNFGLDYMRFKPMGDDQ